MVGEELVSKEAEGEEELPGLPAFHGVALGEWALPPLRHGGRTSL